MEKIHLNSLCFFICCFVLGEKKLHFSCLSTIPHLLLSSATPRSNNTALSSLVFPVAPVEEQERWVGSSEAADVKDKRTSLTSSITTSILSTLHLNHPSMLPSDHLTTTTNTVQDALELWLAGRCVRDGPICLMLSSVATL